MCEQSNVIGIGLVSLFMQFGSTLIYTTSPNFIGTKLFKNDMTFLLVRNIGESTAVFYKLLSGYLSDYVNDRKTFLYIGYGSIILLKSLFWLLTLNVLSTRSATILFVVAHLLDRMMNAIRDAPRDALLFASSHEKENSFAIRKVIGTTGSILAGILCVVIVKNNLVSCQVLYGFALIPIFIANVILHLIVRDIKTQNKENQVQDNKVVNTNIQSIVTKVVLTLGYSLLYYLFFVKNNINIISLKLFYAFFTFATVFQVSPSDRNYIVSYLVSVGSCVATLCVSSQYIPLLENIVFPLFILITYNFVSGESFKKMVQYDLSKYYLLLVVAFCLCLARFNDSLYFKIGEKFILGGSKSVSMIVMFTINYIAQMFCSLIMRKYGPKVSHKFLLFFLLGIFFICNLVCFYTQNIIGTVILAIFLGIINSAYDFIISSMICKYIPHSSIKGTMFGTFYFVVGFGNIFSTLFTNKISSLMCNVNTVTKIQKTSLFCLPFTVIAGICCCFL